MQTLKFKTQPTKAFFATVNEISVRWLLPASDHRRASSNQIVQCSLDNETVLGSGEELGGAAEHLFYGSWLSFECCCARKVID